MATPSQITANQANSQLSTGPISDVGKFNSSRNALRHGFRSQTVILPGEDPAEYEALLTELTTHFAPDDLTESRFVREMADSEWRLRRVRQCIEYTLTSRVWMFSGEARIVEIHAGVHSLSISSLGDDVPDTSYSTWLRYETKFERQYDRAFKSLVTYRKDQARVGRPSVTPAALVELASIVQNPAPPPEPAPDARPDAPQIARSAPCPCGSGEKFKRCCGQNAPPVLSAAAA